MINKALIAFCEDYWRKVSKILLPAKKKARRAGFFRSSGLCCCRHRGSTALSVLAANLFRHSSESVPYKTRSEACPRGFEADARHRTGLLA